MNYTKISGFADEIDSSVVTQFEALNKLGINYFEPRGIDGKNISELNDNEVIALKSLMDKYDIKASAIGSPIGKVNLRDDFEVHFELFKRIVKTCKMLDCKYIRLFSFYHDGEEWSADERTEVIRRLKLMIEYAVENDVVLLHENEKDIYGDTVERCADLMKELACDNFRAILDPANFVQSGEDTMNAYNTLNDNIIYVHIKDAIAENKRVVPVGHGDGNVEFIVLELLKNGYDGFLSLEPHLGTFKGLEGLELDDAMLGLPDSGEGTFTIAFNALNDILNKL